MALTQNGSKMIARALFGYSPDQSALSAVPVQVASSSISGNSVTLGSSQTWNANAQVLVTISGVTYIGFANAAGSASTSLSVDGWWVASTWASSSAPTGSQTVTIVSQPSGAFWLAISGTAQTNYGQTTESTFTELTTNGLARQKAGTVAYTPGTAPTGSSNSTSTLTMTATWTYTGSTSQTINAFGVFCAPYVSGRSNNTLEFATAIASAPTVTTNGDQLVVTETISQS